MIIVSKRSLSLVEICFGLRNICHLLNVQNENNAVAPKNFYSIMQESLATFLDVFFR